MSGHLLNSVEKFIEDNDDDTKKTHLAPYTFVHGLFLSHSPKPRPAHDPLSVMIADKYFRDRTIGNKNGSYLVNQNTDVILFGQRIDKTPPIHGSFFNVKVSEDEQGGFWALKRAPLFLNTIFKISQDIRRQKELCVLFELLDISFTDTTRQDMIKLFNPELNHVKRTQAVIDFIQHIPLEKIQAFFNNPTIPSIEHQDSPLINEMTNLKREYIALKLLKRLKSATLYKGKTSKYKLAIETPLINGFELIDVINKNHFNISAFSWQQQLKFLFKIIKTYQNWTINGILNHGDIKIENLIVFMNDEEELDCQLIDGNFSYTEEELAHRTIPFHRAVGTCNYMAPELLKDRKHLFSADPMTVKKHLTELDIFALGTVLGMFLSIYHKKKLSIPIQTTVLEQRKMHQEYIQNILTAGPVSNLKKTCLEDAIQQQNLYCLVINMLENNPIKRPKLSEIHDFFEKAIPPKKPYRCTTV